MKTKKKAKLWSERRLGVPGFYVRVTELEPGGILYVVRMVAGKQRMRSLGHRDKQQAKADAIEISVGLSKGGPLLDSKRTAAPNPGQVLTLGTLADLYKLHALHGKSAKYQREQPAKVARLVEFLGRDRDVRSLSRSDVQRFAAVRKVAGIRQGTVWADITALKIALSWATDHPREDGSPLLEVNPLARVRVEREVSPRRPVAGEDRYTALKAVADQLPAAFGLALDLAQATGHRIGAILRLRWEDVTFETTPDHPYGELRWYAGQDADNKKTDHVVPMNLLAREALDRERTRQPGIGAAWVFPATADPTVSTGYYVARQWMRRAEKLADLPPLKGGKWHPFRRGWATARKHYPLKDVAEAGGWRDTATLQRSYVHTDAKTILSVVNGPSRGRDSGDGQ